MEDGPKLLPQWLRSSSSSLHHRGDTFDASKRGKPSSVTLTSRPAHVQPDPWSARGEYGIPLNGVSTVVPVKGQPDFGRATTDRGNLSERSWKPRNNGFSTAVSRSSYIPAGLRHSGRDDRDVISLKPGGGYSAGRVYGRPSESEGGAGGRAERSQESWQSVRGTPAGTVSSNGAVQGDDDSRSPICNDSTAPACSGAGIAAIPTKGSYQADFPSLGSSHRLQSPSSAASHDAPQSTTNANLLVAASVPLLSGTYVSSPLQDTAAAPAPYRQTFLSSRTSLNWTSKLAEAPAAPRSGPSSGQNLPATTHSADEDSRTLHAAVCTPAPSPSPPQVAGALSQVPNAPVALIGKAPVLPTPLPVAPPRLVGAWGSVGMATAVAANVDAGHPSIASAIGVTPVSRGRLDDLAVRQSKQLIPVLTSGSGKSKSGVLGGGAGGVSAPGVAGSVLASGMGAGSTGSRGTVGNGFKFVVPSAGLLKMSTGKRDNTAAGPNAAVSGARTLASNTVILSKKASQPLDRPLALVRATSASSTWVATAVTARSPGPIVLGNGSASDGGVVAASSAAGFDSAAAGYSCCDCGGLAQSEAPPPVSATSCDTSRSPISCQTTMPFQDKQSIEPEQMQLQQHSVQQERQSGAQSFPSQEWASAQAAVAPHPALQVSEEEEAFLRSLGWTGFDEEDGDGEDMGLTEEEIAAFRAEQQRQQAAGALISTAAAAKPKAVPTMVARRRDTPLIVAASYGSEQVSSSTDSDSECE